MPSGVDAYCPFREVAERMGIDKELFMKEFNLTDEEFNAPIKDTAHKPESGFETEDVREFVKKQLE